MKHILISVFVLISTISFAEAPKKTGKINDFKTLTNILYQFFTNQNDMLTSIGLAAIYDDLGFVLPPGVDKSVEAESADSGWKVTTNVDEITDEKTYFAYVVDDKNTFNPVTMTLVFKKDSYAKFSFSFSSFSQFPYNTTCYVRYNKEEPLLTILYSPSGDNILSILSDKTEDVINKLLKCKSFTLRAYYTKTDYLTATFDVQGLQKVINTHSENIQYKR